MEKPRTFGARVKALRLQKNMTQPTLASMVGIKQSSLSVIESGRTQPENMKAPTLAKLIAALATTRDYLVEGKETGKPIPATDALWAQLERLYAELSPESRHELVGYANSLHAREYPQASAANPYGKRKKAPALN